ncbi:MAG: DUF3592 domain-containing protein, partial [Verrucomicrobiales bacterium]
MAVGLLGVWSGVKSKLWDEVPCEIERFEIVDEPEGDPPFRVDLKFRYEVDGVRYEGDRLWLSGNEAEYFDEIREAEARIDREGKGPFCRVNPADPHDAVLFAGGGDL